MFDCCLLAHCFWVMRLVLQHLGHFQAPPPSQFNGTSWGSLNEHLTQANNNFSEMCTPQILALEHLEKTVVQKQKSICGKTEVDVATDARQPPHTHMVRR